MQTIRWGIIGLGFFGEKHAEVLSSMPGTELAAVCTRTDAKRKAVAGRFGVNRQYADYTDLLADPEIDAVSITTHVYDHADIAVAALAAGKHVFLEKPMADTVAACDRIVSAAGKAAGKFMVGHICRFDSRISQAREAIAQGRIGRIVSMHAARNLPAAITAQGVLDKISPLLGDGIHDLDLMLWFTGEEVRTVFGRTVQVRDFKYPDIGWAMYTFDSGAVGVTETVWCLPPNTPFRIDARMEIIGTEGAIYIDCGDAGLTITDSTGTDKPDTMYWPAVHGRTVGALRTELEYFADCIRTGRKPDVITAAESRAAVTAVLAAEQSAASGEVVRLQ